MDAVGPIGPLSVNDVASVEKMALGRGAFGVGGLSMLLDCLFSTSGNRLRIAFLASKFELDVGGNFSDNIQNDRIVANYIGPKDNMIHQTINGKRMKKRRFTHNRGREGVPSPRTDITLMICE